MIILVLQNENSHRLIHAFFIGHTKSLAIIYYFLKMPQIVTKLNSIFKVLKFDLCQKTVIVSCTHFIGIYLIEFS